MMVVKTEAPPGIDIERHADLSGRQSHPWWRRAALVVIAAVPVIGLFNGFGQRSHDTRASASEASLSVKSPSHLRGGLMFTTEIVVNPHRNIHDGQIYLDDGWFQNMTLNAVTPQPSNSSSQGRWQTWDFGPMPADQRFVVLVSWQTNPTNVGSHPETVELYDGNNQIVTVHRSLFIFP